MLKFQKVAMFLFLMTISFAPVVVNAQYVESKGFQTPTDAYGTYNPGYGETRASTLIEKIIRWVLSIVAVLSILFIIIGGVMYIISAGGDTTTAKNMIFNAIIGLVIALLGFGIVSLISTFLVK